MAVKEIKKIKEPTIILDEIQLGDIETTEGQDKNLAKTPDSIKLSKLYGTKFPILKIGGRIWDAHEIYSINIHSSGFLPRIDITCQNDIIWEENKLNKESDIVSIFIDSRKEGLKPLRNDYLITYFSNNNGILTISGILNIPSWKNEISKSIKGSSLESLSKLADEHSLGWATNIDKTNDEMIWLQTGKDNEHLFKDIISGSYIDDFTFSDSFIDIYYILNFVNFSNTFEDKQELESSWIDSLLINPAMNNGELIGNDNKLLLTNIPHYEETNFFISNYSIKKDAGKIENTEGTKRNIYFYELQQNKKWDIEVSSDNSVNNISGDKNKKKWLGIIDSDNMHVNYFWSKAFYRKNKIELSKKYLEVTLKNINWNLYRGQKIPIMLIKENLNEDFKGEININKSITGWYTIWEISYHYSIEKGLFQKITLYRKDWPNSVNETT